MKPLSENEMNELNGGDWIHGIIGICVGFSIAGGIATLAGMTATGAGAVVAGGITLACAGVALYTVFE
jgi:hypothetical protein